MTRSCTSRPSTTQASPALPSGPLPLVGVPSQVSPYHRAAASRSVLHRAPTRPHRHGCDSIGRARFARLLAPSWELCLGLRWRWRWRCGTGRSVSGSEDEDELDDETTEGLRHLQARRCRRERRSRTADRLLSRVIHSGVSFPTQRWRGRSCSSTWPRHRSPSRRRRRPVSPPHRIASHRIASHCLPIVVGCGRLTPLLAGRTEYPSGPSGRSGGFRA